MFVAIYCAIQSIVNQTIAGFYAGMKESVEKNYQNNDRKPDGSHHDKDV